MKVSPLFGVTSFLAIFLFCGCSRGPSFTPATLDANEKEIVDRLNLDKNRIAMLKAKPLYHFDEEDLDLYLRFLQTAQPELSKRVVHLARKNIGQPYQIFLLGEYPFEIYDKDPLYRLDKSDCLTFAEHMYAMALGYDWPSFFAFLQRIRYRNGEIGMTTRNHDTIPDWDPENSKWLIYDLTSSIAGKNAAEMTVKTERKKFYKKWNIGQDEMEEVIETSYIPAEFAPEILDQLKDGDFVNVIRGFGKPGYCGHVGLITIGEEGTVNFLHSTWGGVREEPVLDYMKSQVDRNPERREKKKAEFFGFKFFRLRSDAVARLEALDGPHAPKVTGPTKLLYSRYQYPGWVEPRAELTAKDIEAAEKLNLDHDYLALLKARPLYEFDEKEIDDYLGYLQEIEPEIRLRLRHLARKNIGQPYQIYLLGEFPFELYDDAPLFALHKGDCVVFSEHMYAMALSKSWEQFIIFLQRIRFKGGEIGVLTRNHFTAAEWDTSNSWMLEDICQQLTGPDAAPMTATTRHNSFFKKRYGIEVDMPDLSVDTYYVPSEKVPDIAGQLQNGDFVNVIYGSGKSCYAGHVGLITVSEDGTVNFLHATRPRVKEQPLLEYNSRMIEGNVERKSKGRPQFQGFKFLRLRPDYMDRLRELDGPDAPVVKAPMGVMKGPGRRWTP